jgi:cytochrome P450
MVTLLMVAGHETTSGLIGNSLIHLDRRRAARQLLLDRPELAVNAVEELLRYDAPVQGTDRFPTEDIVIGGHEIPAGANLIVMLGAANRDPRVHDRPDELLLDRTRPRPLSFGHGIHHCVGAALARLEAQIAIPAFVQRFPDYRVDEPGIEWKRSVTLKGPTRLPVVVGP